MLFRIDERVISLIIMHQSSRKVKTERNIVGPIHIAEKKLKTLMQKPERKRTKYSVTPDKRNLIEIQRNVNRKRLNQEKKFKHCENLHNLDTIRKELNKIHLMKKKEDQEEVAKSLTFKPQLNNKSRNIMSQRETDYIKRTADWKRVRDDKIRYKREKSEVRKYQREEEARSRPKHKKKNFAVTSKVRLELERQDKDKMYYRSVSRSYRTRSRSSIFGHKPKN